METGEDAMGRRARETEGFFPPRDEGGLTKTRAQTEWRGLGVQQSRGWVHYAMYVSRARAGDFGCV